MAAYRVTILNDDVGKWNESNFVFAVALRFFFVKLTRTSKTLYYAFPKILFLIYSLIFTCYFKEFRIMFASNLAQKFKEA